MIEGTIVSGAIVLWVWGFYTFIESPDQLVRWLCGIACFLSLAWLLGKGLEHERAFQRDHYCVITAVPQEAK